MKTEQAPARPTPVSTPAGAPPFTTPAEATARALLPLVLVGLVAVSLNLRAAITVVPPLLNRIGDDLGLTVALAGVLGALPGLAFATSGLIAPPLLRRWPVERLLVAILVLVAAAQIARPWSPGPLPFVIASAVTLVAMGTGNVLLPVVVKTWFPARIGSITSVYTSALSVGTALPPLLAVPVADLANRAGWVAPGWHAALALWGVFALVPLGIWAVIARRSLHLTGAGRRPSRIRIPVHRSRVAWGVMLVFGMTSLAFYSLAAWLPPRLADAGLSETAAGVQLALLAGLGLPMAVVVPSLMGRIGRPMPFVVTFAVLLAGGEIGLLLAPATFTSLWTICTGLGTGGFPLALTLIGLRSSTPGGAGTLAGFAQGLGYLCGAVGPVLMGLLHAATGGWTAPMLLLPATVPLLVLGGWLARHPRTVEEDLLVPV